jgi:hypothetical protein
VALYEGDDRVEISGYDLDGIIIDGGDGTDAFWSLDSARIDIRLGNRGGVVMGGTTFDLRKFEDAVVEASRIKVTGSRADNTLVLTGCIVHGSGKGGNDALRLGAVEDLTCTERNVKLHGRGGADRLVGSRLNERPYGGRGDDRLKGLRGADTLVGGWGRDKAVGGGGRDRCEAEFELTCEVNP